MCSVRQPRFLTHALHTGTLCAGRRPHRRALQEQQRELGEQLPPLGCHGAQRGQQVPARLQHALLLACRQLQRSLQAISLSAAHAAPSKRGTPTSSSPKVDVARTVAGSTLGQGSAALACMTYLGVFTGWDSVQQVRESQQLPGTSRHALSTQAAVA